MCIRDSLAAARLAAAGRPRAGGAAASRAAAGGPGLALVPVSYTHLRAHETRGNLVCRLLLEKNFFNDTATTEIYTRKIVGSVRCV